MGGVDIGRRRAATPPWPGLVPVRARTGNSTYLFTSRYAMFADIGPSSVRCPSRGHISKTEQHRPIVTVSSRFELAFLELARATFPATFEVYVSFCY